MTSLEENETLRVGDGDDEAETDLGDVDGDGDTDLGDVKFLFVGFMMNKLKNLKINVNEKIKKIFVKTINKKS